MHLNASQKATTTHSNCTSGQVGQVNSGQWDKWTVGQVDSGTSGQWDNWTLGQLGNMQCDKICPLIAPSSEYKNLSMTAGFNTLFAN